MNTVQKSVAACGLAVLAFSTLAAPAGAQALHPLRHAQVRKAARLDRRAAHAALMGHPVKAAKMRAHAARLRSAARHGY